MVIADASGLPIAVYTDSANPHEVRLVQATINEIVTLGRPRRIIGDRAYDSDPVLEQARQQKMEAVIPSRKCRRHQREYDAHVYKERHLVECFFAKLKSFRRIATRYEKLAATFRANVMLAACLIWLQ